VPNHSLIRHLSSDLGYFCTQFSMFPLTRVMYWIESQLSSCLPIHGLQIDNPHVLFQSWSIMASKHISKLAQPRPPCSHDNWLQVYGQNWFNKASKAISACSLAWPPSASSHLLDYRLRVYFSVHSIMASWRISNHAHLWPPSLH